MNTDIHIYYDLVILLLDCIFNREVIVFHTKTYTRTVISALFIIAQTGNYSNTH